MINICINGFLGKMGKSLQEQINNRTDCNCFVGVDSFADNSNVNMVVSDFSKLTEKPDVIIDFSSIEGTKQVVEYCFKNKVPCVICTTGLNDELNKSIEELSKITPVFSSANMSLGINLLIELSKIATKVLGDGYDIELIEKHHRRKLDAPSGTALMIANEINKSQNDKYNYIYNRQPVRQARNSNELGIHAVRGGTIVGEHEVIFAGQDEIISLSHSASSRDVFANGAINAAIFIANKEPNLYNMKDLINKK